MLIRQKDERLGTVEAADADEAIKVAIVGMGLVISRSIIESHGGSLWTTGCQPHWALFQFAIDAWPA